MAGEDVGLKVQGVSVSYGATVALSEASLTVPRGQIVGVMGHNGAGKSTLLNVLSGGAKPDKGTVEVSGVRATRFGDPRHFASLGVTAIHQEPALAPNLSIADNLLAGRPTKSSLGRRSAQTLRVLGELDMTRDPNTPVSVLSLGERQMVDLARGLLDGRVDLLLLDEPAAALGAAETESLHNRVRSLSQAGTSVLYVSHRLPDILDICERIVVLREGKIVLDEPRSSFNARTLASALTDGASEEVVEAPPTAGNEMCLIQSTQGRLSFREGEIVGLFGVAAGPQFEMLDELFRGRNKLDATFDGASYHSSGPSDAIKKGIHLVPSDREQDGLVAGMSAIENVFLPWNADYIHKGQVDVSAQRDLYETIRRTLDIRGPVGTASISSFSGGNRQKHLIARWAFVRRPRMLLLAQPTQGVDQAAKADIRRAVRALAASGVSVVVASAESDELSTLCSRVYALTDHNMQEFQSGPELDERLLTFISGQHETAR